MSDVFQGPGWWMASDGKWYAPERHPDEKYRKQFVVPPEIPSSAFPSVGLDTSDSGVDEIPSSPFSEMVRSVTDMDRAEDTIEMSGEDLRAELTEVEAQRVEIANAAARAAESTTPDVIPDGDVPPVSQPLSSERWIQRSDEREPESAPHTANPATAEPSSVVDEQRPRFSVASPAMAPKSERPVFERAAPASVVEGPSTPRVEGRTELELGRARRATGITVGRQGSDTAGTPAAQPVSTSMALVHVPGPPPSVDHATTFDRVVASVIFSAGVAMIVGSFLNWTAGTLDQTGWERGDGMVAVVAGVLGAAASGPIFVGFRHIVPKFVAVIAGLIGIAAVGLVAIDVLLDEQDTGTTLALGFVVVLVGAIAMIGAGLADRGEVLH